MSKTRTNPRRRLFCDRDRTTAVQPAEHPGPPDDVASLIAQADAAYKAGDFTTTRVHLRRAIEADPTKNLAKWKLSALLGRYQSGVPDLREALRLADEVLVNYPDNRDAHIVASAAAYKLGLFDRHREH